MRVLVGVKRVVDYAVKIRVRPDKSGVDTANVKMSMNPFDEIAVEEALRMKAAGVAKEIVALSIGPKGSEESLRTALAMGADRAILVPYDKGDLPTLTVAKVFRGIVDLEKPGLVVLGKQAIDDDANQTGQLLAGLLKWPQGTFASKVVVHPDKGLVTVTREIDGGLETLSLKLPAVITCDLRLNTPRFAALPQILRARKMPITNITLEQLGIEVKPTLETLSVEEPGKRKAGTKVDSVETLLLKLKNEAKVI